MPELKHDGPVLELAFSPDGRRLATASDKTARIWDVNTGQLLAPPLVHAGLVRTIAFSPDGERLATGSYDWTARIWDASSGAPLTPFLHHDDNVNRVAFSSDGALLATASGGPTRAKVGDARVWDAATGEPLTPWLRHGNDVLDCRFDRAGKFLYTASWDRRVRKWELPLDQRPLDELQHLAELSAGYRIDKMTGIASVESSEFRSRWPAQNTRERSIVTRSPGALAQWHQQRSAAAMRNREWPLAGYHLAKLDEVRPDDVSLLSQLAPIQLYLGDRDGYHETRRKLVALWRDNRPELLSNVAGVSLLDPGQQDDLPETFAALARSVDQNPKSCAWLHLHGAVAYRVGNVDKCVRSLDRAKAIHGGQSPPQDELFQAMASGRTGNLAAARQLLDHCRQSIEVQRMAQPENLLADPSQYLAIEILGREAQLAVGASE